MAWQSSSHICLTASCSIDGHLSTSLSRVSNIEVRAVQDRLCLFVTKDEVRWTSTEAMAQRQGRDDESIMDQGYGSSKP